MQPGEAGEGGEAMKTWAVGRDVDAALIRAGIVAPSARSVSSGLRTSWPDWMKRERGGQGGSNPPAKPAETASVSRRDVARLEDFRGD